MHKCKFCFGLYPTSTYCCLHIGWLLYAVLMVGIVALYGCYHGWLLYAIHKVCSKIVPVNASWLIVELRQLPLIVVIMVDCCMLSLQLVLSNCNGLSMPVPVHFRHYCSCGISDDVVNCTRLKHLSLSWLTVALYPTHVFCYRHGWLLSWIVLALTHCRHHDLLLYGAIMVDCWIAFNCNCSWLIVVL